MAVTSYDDVAHRNPGFSTPDASASPRELSTGSNRIRTAPRFVSSAGSRYMPSRLDLNSTVTCVRRSHSIVERSYSAHDCLTSTTQRLHALPPRVPSLSTRQPARYPAKRS